MTTQSLKKIFTNWLMGLGLSFGLIFSAIASDDIRGFENQAEQGNARAQSVIPLRYQLDKNGLRQDYTESYEWFKKRADEGSVEGQYFLGYIYYRGKGVRKDYTKSYEWFKKAADQNYGPAQATIGLMHMEGKGVDQNFTQAKEWFSKSCDNELEDGCDMYRYLNEKGY